MNTMFTQQKESKLQEKTKPKNEKTNENDTNENFHQLT